MGTLYLKISFFFIIFSFTLHLPALDPSRKIHQYIQRSWQTIDGLPQNSAHALAQTDDGYMWIATQEGLARFDGVSFKIFNRTDDPQLGSNDIRALFKASDGSLWIGTYGGGAAKYSKGAFQLFNKENGLSDNLIKTVYVDGSGCAWLGTYKNGISIICGGKITKLTSSDGLPDDSIRAITGEKDVIWAGTTKGLAKISKGRVIKVYRTADGLKNDNISSIFIDGSSVIWTGTKGGFVHSITGNRIESFSVAVAGPADFVNVIFKDRDQNLWIGTDSGLHRKNYNDLETFTTADGLTYNSVRSIFEDSEGSLWVGTSGGGINIFSEGAVKTISYRDGLTSTDVLPVLYDSSGNLWAGTANSGLDVIRSDGTHYNYSSKNGLNDLRILSLLEDESGMIWIGTLSGLNLLDPLTGIIRPVSNISAPVSTLLKEYGIIWAGTHGEHLIKIKEKDLGLIIEALKGKKPPASLILNTEIIDKDQGLSDGVILSFIPDRLGSYYIGTMNGLFIFDGNSAKEVHNGLSSRTVYSLHFDDSGTLWAGTDSGLNFIKEGSVFQIQNRDFLSTDSVFSVFKDMTGTLWLSSNKGIFSASSAEIVSAVTQGKKDFQFRRYTQSDGMKSMECNGGFSPAYSIDKNGNIAFPTINGIALVSEGASGPPKVPFGTIIESVRSENNEFIDFSGGSIVFPPGSRKFEIKYTAPSFSSPSGVKFRYKLSGFDPSLVEAGTRRTAYYTNLRPGTYNFTVTASNDGIIWNDTEKGIKIVIEPFFYQTYWFYTLLIVFLLSAGGIPATAFFRKKIKKVEREKMELEKRAVEAETRYQKSRLDEEFSTGYLEKLFSIMDSEKLYRNPNLTLQQLADRMKISHLYLSQIINLNTGMTFYTFLNMYRILEVMEKLQMKELVEENIISIAFDSGFNTKSSFNSVFKKFTNLTPSEYRKKFFV